MDAETTLWKYTAVCLLNVSFIVVIGMEKLVTIRRAKPSDKEAVLKIHDHVYDGQDYLPAYYDHFLSSSDFLTFVMIIYEEIIAFEVIHVVDDGQTLVGRAGRISPKHERKGYIKHFSASMEEWQKRNSIKLIAFTATDANPAVSRSSFQQANRLVLTCQMPLYCMDVHKITLSEMDIQQAVRLTAATDRHLARYFQSQDISKYISPQGRMIVDMVPLKMIPSNIRFMKGPERYTSVFSDIRMENGKCSGLLSFGTVFPIPRPPFHCNLDIFGSDTKTLKQHIIRHLLVMQGTVKGEVAILVMVQEDFDMNKLDGVFEDFGIKRKIWYDSTYPTLRYSQLYLYERDAHSSKL